MIFKDRQGENLNRRKIKIISQSATEILADIERADTVTEEGTPINASVFNNFQSQLDSMNNSITTAVDYSDIAVSNANTAYTTANEAKASANEITNSFNAFRSTFIDLTYPVGSIYMSVNSTSPSTLFGGSWSQLADRFLIGAGSTYTNGATGGEVSHTLTVDELPSHDHIQQAGKTNEDGYMWERLPGTGQGNGVAAYNNWISESLGLPLYTTSTGGGQSHNNMPPYLAVYMWKRIA